MGRVVYCLKALYLSLVSVLTVTTEKKPNTTKAKLRPSVQQYNGLCPSIILTCSPEATRCHGHYLSTPSAMFYWTSVNGTKVEHSVYTTKYILSKRLHAALLYIWWNNNNIKYGDGHEELTIRVAMRTYKYNILLHNVRLI